MSSQLKRVVGNHDRDFANLETLLHHEKLLNDEKLNAQKKPHTFGVRKNLIGGREFFIIENPEKQAFSQTIKHPTQLPQRLLRLIKVAKTAIYQRLHIDTTTKKNEAYVAQFEETVKSRVPALAERHAVLKEIGEYTNPQINQINALKNEVEALKKSNEELTEHNLKHVREKGALDEDIRKLKNKLHIHRSSKEKAEERVEEKVPPKIKKQSTLGSVLGSVENKVGSFIHTKDKKKETTNVNAKEEKKLDETGKKSKKQETKV